MQANQYPATPKGYNAYLKSIGLKPGDANLFGLTSAQFYALDREISDPLAAAEKEIENAYKRCSHSDIWDVENDSPNNWNLICACVNVTDAYANPEHADLMLRNAEAYAAKIEPGKFQQVHRIIEAAKKSLAL